MNAVYLAGYGEIGTNNYISGSVAYFSVGNITLSDGVTAMETNPSEWAIDLGYSRRLTPYLSLGVAFRYASAIYADLNALNILHAGAFAVDAGAYFQLPVGQNKIFAGVSITNIGTQFQFADTTASLPTALRLGVNYTFNFTPEHGLSLGVEGNQPFVSGAKNSFDRATFGFGAEYSWKQTLMARAGYFYNNKNYGDRSHVSIGVGGRLEGFGVDASYWIPTSSSNTALDNTFHITLSYIFR